MSPFRSSLLRLGKFEPVWSAVPKARPVQQDGSRDAGRWDTSVVFCNQWFPTHLRVFFPFFGSSRPEVSGIAGKAPVRLCRGGRKEWCTCALRVVFRLFFTFREVEFLFLFLFQVAFGEPTAFDSDIYGAGDRLGGLITDDMCGVLFGSILQCTITKKASSQFTPTRMNHFQVMVYIRCNRRN